MRREELKALKKSIAEKMPNTPFKTCMVYVNETYTNFSVSQLKLLCEILTEAEKIREKHETWHALSVNEAVNVNSGKIVCVDNDGNVFEKSEEDIARGASCKLYEHWKKSTHFEKEK